jgi:hypothetical protein
VISAGEAQQVKRWTLNALGQSLVPEIVLTSSSKINTVDLIETEQSLLVASGDDKHHVNLKRLNKENPGGN